MYYYVHSLKSHYQTCDQKGTLVRVINNKLFILHYSFVLFTFESTYLNFHFPVWAEHKLNLKSIVPFRNAMESQWRGTIAGHHLSHWREGSKVIRKGNLYDNISLVTSFIFFEQKPYQYCYFATVDKW